MIILDNKQIIGPFFFNQIMGRLLLGMHGIQSHHPAFKIQRVKKRPHGGDFIGFAFNRLLSQNTGLLMEESRKEMLSGSLEGFPIDRNR